MVDTQGRAEAWHTENLGYVSARSTADMLDLTVGEDEVRDCEKVLANALIIESRQ